MQGRVIKPSKIEEKLWLLEERRKAPGQVIK